MEKYTIINNKFLRKQRHTNLLFHSISEERSISILEENTIKGYSIQRIWNNGIRLKDDQPGYDDSNFMRGICTSRDIRYVARWNTVVFVLDKDKLKTKYKIVPYNWGYSIGRGYRQNMNAKNEREEFILMGISQSIKINSKTGKQYKNKSTYRDYNRFIKMVNNPIGEISLDYILGFYLVEDKIKFINDIDLNFFKKHPKYLGIIGEEKK